MAKEHDIEANEPLVNNNNNNDDKTKTKSSSSSITDSVPTSLRDKYLALAIYFAFNLGLTLYNKAVMMHFPFPWVLTGIHALFGTLGSYFFYKKGSFIPASLERRDNVTMLAFSVLYTVNIAISNVSLQMVTVPFHQVVRALTPVFTVAIYLIFFGRAYAKEVLFSLVPVIAGVGLATYGDYSYTRLGFFLTILGTVLAAMKTVATNRILVGKLKLHPLDLLLRMSPLALVQTAFYAFLTGELSELQVYLQENLNTQLALQLIANGMMAFGLNVVSFTANKKTGALTMTVAANVKQVLTVILAVIIFNLEINLMNGLGIAVTIAGGAWYAKVELNNKQKSSSANASSSSTTSSRKEEIPEVIVEQPTNGSSNSMLEMGNVGKPQ